MSSNQSKKERWLLYSTLLNIVLAISKLAVGILTSTSVIIADGIHSLSDVVNSVLIYVSMKLAGKKSKKFPFGMHKLEDFAALVGGTVIVYAGFEIARSVIFAAGGMVVEHLYIVVIFLFAVLASQAAFAFFEKRASRKLNSPGVKTDLCDWMLDIGATVVAILGVVLSYYKIPYAQKIAVSIIVLIIFHGAYKIIKDAVLTLIDASVDAFIIKKAESVIKSYSEVENIDTLFIRKAGSIFIADIVLQIREKSMSVAHDIVEKIEQDLKNNIEHLQIITIHYEPAKKSYKKIAVFLTNSGSVACRFKEISAIEVKEVDENGTVLNFFKYKNSYIGHSRGYFSKLIVWLVKQNIEEVVFNPDVAESEKMEIFKGLGITVKNIVKGSSS